MSIKPKDLLVHLEKGMDRMTEVLESMEVVKTDERYISPLTNASIDRMAQLAAAQSAAGAFLGQQQVVSSVAFGNFQQSPFQNVNRWGY